MEKITTIDLPHAVLEEVGEILHKAGFELGTVGCGFAQMEREGDLSQEEAESLRKQMAEVLFVFDVEEVEEDEGED